MKHNRCLNDRLPSGGQFHGHFGPTRAAEHSNCVDDRDGGGYFINAATGQFDPTHPAIVEDAKDTANPRTVFGLIVTALGRRRANGTPPFTVLSCDNVVKNGEMAHNACVGTARALGQTELADWISENVAFPNGMVDRITPVTGDIERVACQQNHGIEDAWPVFCESFKQWVLEDNFRAGRPALEKEQRERERKKEERRALKEDGQQQKQQQKNMRQRSRATTGRRRTSGNKWSRRQQRKA
ncbi:hypothetical protein niasHS_005179 [Heterodera schachtii]|uniref:mannitol 2-dehydrogenase n=1 Tax=Heterodera schachtii TaxID=97005 RepID=A0ABD2JRP0_HETSC